MKITTFSALSVLIIIFLLSCSSQKKFYIPEPDFSVYAAKKSIDIDNIIETKSGSSARSIPGWLLTYIDGGNRAVEQIDFYKDKYVFIDVNEGENFSLLNKWAENFTTEQDFAILAAIRIEERMIQTSSLYPDDEYGKFFLAMVKNAYSAEYQNAVKEETFWFKKSSPAEIYYYFILITIDKIKMQSIIRDMIARAYTEASPSGSQGVSVNRLRQTFFEGF